MKLNGASRLLVPALVAGVCGLGLVLAWNQVECWAPTGAVVQDLPDGRIVILREDSPMAFGAGHQVVRLCDTFRGVVDEARFSFAIDVEGLKADEVCFRLGVVNAADGPLARREASEQSVLGPLRATYRIYGLMTPDLQVISSDCDPAIPPLRAGEKFTRIWIPSEVEER